MKFNDKKKREGDPFYWGFWLSLVAYILHNLCQEWGINGKRCYCYLRLSCYLCKIWTVAYNNDYHATYCFSDYVKLLFNNLIPFLIQKRITTHFTGLLFEIIFFLTGQVIPFFPYVFQICNFILSSCKI